MVERYIVLIIPIFAIIIPFFIIENFRKRNPLNIFILILITLISVFCSAEVGLLADFILYFSLFIFAYRLNQQTTVFNSLLNVSLVFLSRDISNWMIEWTIKLHFRENIFHFYSLDYESYITLLTSLFLSIIFAYICRLYLIPHIEKNNWTAFTASGVALIWIVNKMSTQNYYGGLDDKKVIVVFSLVFTMLLIIVIKVFFDNQQLEQKAVEQKAKETILTNYVDEVNNQYKTMRTFQHDYVNILSTTKLYLDQNDLDGLRLIYDKVLSKSILALDTTELRLNNLQKIKSEILKSIIYTKLIEAQGKNIVVSLEVPEEINIEIDNKELVLIRILGIIFDNAIEELTQVKNGTLNFAIFRKSSSTFFILENSLRRNIDTSQILSQKGYTSKGKNRGIGLSNIAQLKQEMNRLYIETIIEDGKFIQKLILVDKEK